METFGGGDFADPRKGLELGIPGYHLARAVVLGGGCTADLTRERGGGAPLIAVGLSALDPVLSATVPARLQPLCPLSGNRRNLPRQPEHHLMGQVMAWAVGTAGARVFPTHSTTHPYPCRAFHTLRPQPFPCRCDHV